MRSLSTLNAILALIAAALLMYIALTRVGASRSVAATPPAPVSGDAGRYSPAPKTAPSNASH